MRVETITRVLYEFDELSNKSQENALDQLGQDIASYDWWKQVYEDSEQIGLQIDDFDISQNTIHGHFLNSAEDVVISIIANHGESTETYKDAKLYLSELDKLSIQSCETIDISDIDNEFKNKLLKDYLVMLRDEWDYLNSEKAIVDLIEINGYKFTEDGKLA